MTRFRRMAAAALAASLLVFGSAATASAAGNPNAHFTFSICQTTVDGFDADGNPIGPVPAIEMLYAWSGAYVDDVSGAWTRTDGQPVLFSFDDSDFRGATAGSVDAGALTIMTDDPGLDGLVGSFAVHHHVISTQHIPEPIGGWTSVAACA